MPGCGCGGSQQAQPWQSGSRAAAARADVERGGVRANVWTGQSPASSTPPAQQPTESRVKP